KDANIVIDGKAGNLAGIPKGAVLNVIFCAERMVASRLMASGPQVSGIEEAAEADNNNITPDVKPYTGAKDADIAPHGKAEKLTAITAGSRVIVLILSVDQRNARLIHARRP